MNGKVKLPLPKMPEELKDLHRLRMLVQASPPVVSLSSAEMSEISPSEPGPSARPDSASAVSNPVLSRAVNSLRDHNNPQYSSDVSLTVLEF